MTESRYRLAARFSVFLPFVAFTASCVYQQLFLKASAPEGIMQREGYYAFSVVMAACFLAGIALAAYGLFGALRSRSGGAIAVATMGLVLNLGAVLVTVLAYLIVTSQQG